MLLKPSPIVVQENPLKYNHVEHGVNHDVYKKSNYHLPMIQSELQTDYFQQVSLICLMILALTLILLNTTPNLQTQLN